jgi:hypothetical protein
MSDGFSDDFRPDKFHLSNSEIRATGQLGGGAVANICRELLRLREQVYSQAVPSQSRTGRKIPRDDDDVKGAAIEAYWQAKQGDEYGSY